MRFIHTLGSIKVWMYRQTLSLPIRINPNSIINRVAQCITILYDSSLIAEPLNCYRHSPYPGSVLFDAMESRHIRWPSILLNACIILIFPKRFRVLPSRSTKMSFLLYLITLPLVIVKSWRTLAALGNISSCNNHWNEIFPLWLLINCHVCNAPQY